MIKRKIKQLLRTDEIRAIEAEVPKQREEINQLAELIFQDIDDPSERANCQFYERLYKISGTLKSSKSLSANAKLAAEVYFHHRDKAEVAMTVGSSWYGGDYFEFGAHAF